MRHSKCKVALREGQVSANQTRPKAKAAPAAAASTYDAMDLEPVTYQRLRLVWAA